MSETTTLPPGYGRQHWWARPLGWALLLVLVDGLMMGQGSMAVLFGLYLVLIYLPRSFAKVWRPVRSERLKRLSIYLAAVVVTGAIVAGNIQLARQRADQIVLAVEHYKARHGGYPARLEQLVPDFLPAIPSPKLDLSWGEFRYRERDGEHILDYVEVQPFGRRIYMFERAEWRMLD